MNEILEIANTYMEEHDGELPLLIIAKNADETRIIRGQFREKHYKADQATFINVMRLAMIIYGYTSYQFVVKPEFDYEALQMTMNVWAVGTVSEFEQTSEFFTIEDDKLVPYFEEMPIGGFIAQLLPTKAERKQQIDTAVVKQIKMYIENSTYKMPKKVMETEEAIDAFQVLFDIYDQPV